MRLYSNRGRAEHRGPLALERLARDAAAPIGAASLPQDSVASGPDAVTPALSEYLSLFSQFLDGSPAAACAPVPEDPVVRANNLKASAYFMDAIAAGCCAFLDEDRVPSSVSELPPTRIPPHPAALEGARRAWTAAFKIQKAAGTQEDFNTRLFELRAEELSRAAAQARSDGDPRPHEDRIGVLRLGIDALRAAPLPPSHRHVFVFLVEFGREPRDGDPGATWIRGANAARTDLRATEIAVVLSGYLRWLGFDARGHVAGDTRVDLTRLAVRAGLARIEGGRLVAPFLRRGFRIGAVTTAYALAPDIPLAATGPLFPDDPDIHLGVGGTRPGWHDEEADRRPLHLGAWPMEEIPRVDRPTTLVLHDEIARVPKRADFFKRAEAGDLGEIAQREIKRFAMKYPLSLAMLPLLVGVVPSQGTREKLSPTGVGGDLSCPRRNADAIKALGYFLGADLVGICRAEPWMYYSHDEREGRPIPAYHQYAVVMLIDQGFETMEGASGDDWISATQSMRAYIRGAEIAGVMAAHCRRMGFSARSHTNAHSEVIHNPAILLAGLAEVSRIGETLLNPFIGPRSKSVVFTTDLPMEVDLPIDFGLQDFCEQCRKCARECPCNAIPYGPKVMFNGYEIWKADVDKCTKYRVTQSRGSACGRCMKMCPWNREDTAEARELMWLSIRSPSSRRYIAEQDDRLGHGTRVPVKRWWFDLEMVGGVAVTPPAGVNERDLDLGRDAKLAPHQRLALFPPTLLPPPTVKMDEVYKVDRAAGVAAYAAAEKPAAAAERVRLKLLP